MSLNRYAVQRDANEPEIVEALEAIGAKVIRLDAFDLLVLYNGIHMIEVKKRMAQKETAKGRYGRKRPSQEALVADGWPLRFVTDTVEAFRAIGFSKMQDAIAKCQMSSR